MSIKIMSWVLDHSPYEGKQRLIHVVLADHASDEGYCWPSQATIAKRAGCSVEHVRMTVKEMVNDGFLEIVKQSTTAGTTHHYVLKAPKSFGEDAISPTDGKPAYRGDDLPKSSTTPPQVDRPSSPNPSPRNHQEPSLNTTITLSSDDRGFAAFWAAYPRKEAKQAARVEWVRLMDEGMDALTLTLGANRLANDPNREPKFTPLPAKWLKEHRWEDDPLPPRSSSSKPNRVSKFEELARKFATDDIKEIGQ